MNTYVRRSRAWWQPEWVVYAAATLVTAVLTFFALELWKGKLSVPFTYTGDALPTAAHFKTVMQEGWYEYQPRLSAPLGQSYNDFPTADNLHMVAAKVLGLFTSDWALALNLYFLAGFALTAITMVWFLRTCGVSKVLTVALATLYALAPYHFIRGESHLWLGSYYGVPLALGLLVLILGRKPLWGRGSQSSPVLAWLFSPTTRTLVFIVILAMSSSYYAVFFLILLATTGIAVLIRDGLWAPFWGAVAAGIWTVIIMLVNMLPDMIFSRINGVNQLGLERSRGETEFYALKFAQLVLPWSGHRNDSLRELRVQYDNGYLSLGEQPALGAIAALGFIAAFLLIGGFLIRRGNIRIGAEDRRWNLLAGLSLLILVAFLFGTVGGLSTIVSFLTSSLRGWNRISIVIMALSLAVIGLLIDLGIERIRRRSSLPAVVKRSAALIACLAVLGIGFYDQTPRDAAQNYEATATRFAADHEWFQSIESELPTGSMVLVMPYIPFPELSSPNGFLASDQLVPYLQSDELRWTMGGIKGRPQADWPRQLSDYPAEDLATLAATAGSAGILVMRDAIVDRGQGLESAITASTGVEPRVSADGRYAFFNLESVSGAISESGTAADEQSVGSLITNPVTSYPYPGFSNGLDEDKVPYLGGSGDNAAFTLVNDTESTRTVTVSFNVVSGVDQGTVTVTWPDGSTAAETHVTADAASFQATIDIPPGSHQISVNLEDANGGPVADSIVKNLSVREAPIVAFLGSLSR